MMARKRKSLTLTITLPAEVVPDFNAAWIAERERRNVFGDTTAEAYASLMVERGLALRTVIDHRAPAPQEPAEEQAPEAAPTAPPGLCVAFDPDTTAFLRLILAEGTRRGWLPEDMTVEEFARSGAYQIAKLLFDYKWAGLPVGDMRLLDEPKTVVDYTGSGREWIAVIE
jgi:hypothetical protein